MTPPIKRLVIDARESGTSTGRYVDKLLEHMHRLNPEFDITVLTKSPRLAALSKTCPSFKVEASDFKEFTFAEQLGFLKQLRSLKPDLVHFSMTQQPVLYKGKVVTTVHDLTTARFNNPAKNWLVFKLKQLVYRAVIKRVTHKSRYIITASQFVKNDLVNYTSVDKTKIKVIYEAADKITDPPEVIDNLKGKKFIMYVGRPTPHKNLERLIEAFRVLHKTDSSLQLVLAGRTDRNYEATKRLVSRLDLSDSVIFTGFINEGQLRWLYEHTTAYVFPSLSEGFGLPGLEAMIHGAPVVSSNATCLPEIYGEAGHYFNPKDVDEMAAKIYEVVNSTGLREELIKKGQAQAAKYSWDKTAHQTLEVYKQILR